MKILAGIFLLILLNACSEDQPEIKDLRSDDARVEQTPSEDATTITPNETPTEPESTDAAPTSENSEWSYEVVFISEKNWGYQLFQNGTMKINQTSIPSVQGIDGFDTKEKAERTAKHILKKLENGIFPPTVNKEELDSLNVLRN